MNILLVWLINTLGIAVTSYLLPGVTVGNFGVALVTALVLGVVNAFIRPLLVFLTLPINILTFGLFTFVINALMIMLVSAIVPGFKVKDFGNALIFAVILLLINSIFYYIFY